MALTDPQSINYDGSAVPLPLITRDKNGTTYRNPDGSVELVIQHAKSKRSRDLIQLNQTETVTDALTGLSVRDTVTYNATVNHSDLASVVRMVKGLQALATWITASSAANATKVVGGES